MGKHYLIRTPSRIYRLKGFFYLKIFKRPAENWPFVHLITPHPEIELFEINIMIMRDE